MLENPFPVPSLCKLSLFHPDQHKNHLQIGDSHQRKQCFLKVIPGVLCRSVSFNITEISIKMAHVSRLSPFLVTIIKVKTQDLSSLNGFIKTSEIRDHPQQKKKKIGKQIIYIIKIIIIKKKNKKTVAQVKEIVYKILERNGSICDFKYHSESLLRETAAYH